MAQQKMSQGAAREKAKKLVGLAVDTKSGNEARNAALSACKLIAEYDLLSPSTVANVAATVAGMPDMVDRVRQAAADPEVRATAAAVGMAASNLAEAFGRVAGTVRKARGR